MAGCDGKEPRTIGTNAALATNKSPAAKKGQPWRAIRLFIGTTVRSGMSGRRRDPESRMDSLGCSVMHPHTP